MIDVMQHSPFFEVFEPEYLAYLERYARPIPLEKGNVIFEEGSDANALYMLVNGKVLLSIRGKGTDDQLPIRTLSDPGQVVGWSAMVEPHRYPATVTALEHTQMAAFDREVLEGYANKRPNFGVDFMQRILWVIGNRLRATRVRLVARRYEKEILAIRSVLDQSTGILTVTSPLHKIPHYLENRLTLSDAFHCLELLQLHGDRVERSLAELCLGILENVRNELTVYQRLQTIYELVANAPRTMSPEEVRKQCCLEFNKLFGEMHYIIQGQDNLPDRSGHIFVMNHLSNHPDNTLPNDFQLVLDTHFVSAMVLFKKYGEAPIRIIRKSHPDEYGHQRYYDRLGYVYVYRGYVDESGAEPHIAAQERLRLFLDAAKAHLLTGKNIVICPEGTSTETESSPLPFKAGAFRLAAYVRPEPLIVPIAVANLDKKITQTKAVAVVHKPFHLSEFVPDPVEDRALFGFINSFQQTFRTYVREAVQLATTPPPAVG